MDEVEPDCEDCLDVGEVYVVTNEQNGDGLWHQCPCRYASEYAAATAGWEEDDE